MSRYFPLRYILSRYFPLRYFPLKCFIAGLVFVLVVVGFRHFSVMHFLAANASDTIHKNISINGVDVGGLSPEQASNILQKDTGIGEQVIRFTYNNSLIYSLTFADFEAKYDFTSLAQEAFSYGRTGTRRERYLKLRELGQEIHNIQGEPLYSYNEYLIPGRLDIMRTQVSIQPVSATMRLESSLGPGRELGPEPGLGPGPSQFVITEGKPGRTPDILTATTELRQILASKKPGQIELEMHEVQPMFNESHLTRSQSLLGKFSTPYPGGEELPRSINIRLAASLLNNTVVYPGTTFSTREALAPFSPERGYTMSAVIVDGQLAQDYGGGICQVASTLYNAILYAELKVVERANHSLRVFYLDFGFDAAIAGDYMDLKFQNNTEYPLLIAASAVQGLLEVRIYGHETRAANRRIAFVNELIEVIPPGPDKVLVDENLPSGHVLVNTAPQDGFKYELFRLVFVDDRQVARERVNVSVYRAVQGVITKGVGET